MKAKWKNYWLRPNIQRDPEYKKVMGLMLKPAKKPTKKPPKLNIITWLEEITIYCHQCGYSEYGIVPVDVAHRIRQNHINHDIASETGWLKNSFDAAHKALASETGWSKGQCSVVFSAKKNLP